MIYRPDIDGLRAFAVMAVFLFHAHIAPFSGGFVGVDIFFVISGYLITSILMADLEAKRYSYFGFLYRRARRILPALLVMLVLTLPFAWSWMFPRYLIEYARTFAPAALFYPNVQLGTNVHYAASTVDTHALVHTWTLGVEAQFYLVYPLLFVVLFRNARRLLPFVLLGLAGLSFGAMIWQHYANPVTTFFLFQYRAWEFLAGALVASTLVGRSFRGSGFLAVVGLGMTLASMFWLDEKTPFPSAVAALPVIGTALVIRFTTPNGLLFKLLAFKPFVGLGLVSYSFYLLHQPVLAFARMRHIGELEPPLIAGLFALTLGLSYLSWRFVEQYFRGNRAFGLGAKALQGAALAAVVAVGFGLRSEVLSSWGVPKRFGPEVRRALAGPADFPFLNSGCMNAKPENAYAVVPRCRLGVPSDNLDFILIGDSYAEALAPGVSLAAQNAGKAGVFWGVAACPPVLGVTGSWFKTRQNCARFKEGMIEHAAALKPDMVILHGLWLVLNNPGAIGAPGANAETTVALFSEAMKRTITGFQEAGIEVVVILQKPPAPFFVPERLAKAALFNIEEPQTAPMPAFWYRFPMNQVLHDPAVMDGVAVFDPTQVLCDESTCQVVIDGYPLARDRGHLTGYAARYLAPYMQDVIWPAADE